MKTHPIGIIILIVVCVLSSLSSRADAASYAQVLKERDAILSRILAEQESRRASGLADEDAIAAAQIALHSFRRAVAPTTAEKIKLQGLIVRLYEGNLTKVKAKFSSGIGSNLEVLVATEKLLQATQDLEELKLSEKKG